MKPVLLPLCALMLLPACAGGGGRTAFLPAAEVLASAETAPVGTSNADAADDPAIWRNAATPSASLIVGTDKKAGLYVYGLNGEVKSFFDAGAVNNVDLIGGPEEALVVASDRNDKTHSRIALFTLRFDDPVLKPLGAVESGPGEAYGICLQRRDVSADLSTVTAYAAIKDGTVREVMLTRREDGGYDGKLRRQWKLGSQIEGCVTSPRSGDLYIGEEDVGIWRIRTMIMDAAPQPEAFATTGAGDGLVADVEGLAYAANFGGADYLITSSQGDNAYALFDAVDGRPLGRFRIVDGVVDGTSETDGIELALGDFGPDYPDGLFIAQDGSNPGAAQNFKLVSWSSVLKALSLPQNEAGPVN